MGLFNFFKKDIFHSPEYFERLGECDQDCLVCDHIDIDCHGDDDWEIEMEFEEGAFDDDEDDW